MPWRNEEDEWGNPSPMPMDSMRGQAAWNDYAAATRDMDPSDRPAFDMDEWTTPAPGTVTGYEPTTAPWARDDQQQPVCPTCVSNGCPGAYGGHCPSTPDPYNPGSYY